MEHLDARVGIILRAGTGIMAWFVATETFDSSVCLAVGTGDKATSLQKRHANVFFVLSTVEVSSR